MTAQNYQAVLSEKTQLLIQLEKQKQALQAQEDRKSQLIAAIAEASAQIDSADDQAQSVQSQIKTMQAELDQIEASLSKEQKLIYNSAQKTLNAYVEKAKRYNLLIREAVALWNEIIEPLDEKALTDYRIGLSASHPVNNLANWEFQDYAKFSELPEFTYTPNSHLSLVSRKEKHPRAL